MASRVVNRALFVAFVVSCVISATADHLLQLGNSSSSGSADEVLLLEFPGHPAIYCGYHSFPEVSQATSTLHFTVLQRGEDGHSVRDTLNCTLAGDLVDFRLLVEDNMLIVRRTALVDPELEVELAQVECVLEPHAVPAALFDFRATRLGAGLPPFQCLMLTASRDLVPPLDTRAAPPERDALVFRFQNIDVPDLVCQSFSDVPLAQSDIEVELLGFLNQASGPLNCHFRRVFEGQSTPALLRNLSLEFGLSLQNQSYRPPALTLPGFTCGGAWKADQTGAASDATPAEDAAASLSAAFTVTGPSSRWALCRLHSVRRALRIARLEFPNMPTLVCALHGVPVGGDVEGADFQFLLQMDSSHRFHCKFAVAGTLGAKQGLESHLRQTLEEAAKEMGVGLRLEDGVPLIEMPAFFCLERGASSRLPTGSRFLYILGDKEQSCVLMTHRVPPVHTLFPPHDL